MGLHRGAQVHILRDINYVYYDLLTVWHVSVFLYPCTHMRRE